MKRLCGVVIALNEEAHITECLQSLAFCDGRLVVDAFSTDATVARARAANAEVIQREFDHFAGQRNAALDAVRGQYEWVLFLDADERIPPALADEILQALNDTTHAGFRIPRHNYLFGRLTRGAGWFPDYQTRLLRANAAHYDPERKVHEVVVLDGELGTLSVPLVHYNYVDTAHFHRKQRSYTRYEAQILYEAGVRPKPHNYLLQPLRQFRWRFWTLKGYQDGLHGLHLSLLMAWYEWRKYVLLGQMWRSGGAAASAPHNKSV
jgi:glycosyltransferase involved in cell wall biosynthesis